jgi:hypothetical protein
MTKDPEQPDQLAIVASKVTSLRVIGIAITTVMLIGVWYARLATKIDQATPLASHDSLVRAMVQRDSSLSRIERQIGMLQRYVLVAPCIERDYPSPFCDSVPHIPRRSP